MRDIIKEWLRKMEFLTGLKQFREMSLDDAKTMVDFLENKVKEYSWMTEARLNEIFKNGMEGGYGEFYSMNVRTLSTWCNTYYDHHKQKIIVEQFPKGEEKQESEEEIQKWLEVGRQLFVDCWEDAKKGVVKDLFFWGPYHYKRLEEKGILIPENYQVNEKELIKQLRLERGLSMSGSDIVSRKKNLVWKMFIRDCVSKKINLPDFI